MASHLIGDMSGSTLDDPLSDCYEKLACSISALEKDSDDYKMIVNYLEKTYEPVKLGDIVRMTLLYAILVNRCSYYLAIMTSYFVMQEYGVSVDKIFVIESNAQPSLDEIKKLPNKVLLWCGEFVNLDSSYL